VALAAYSHDSGGAQEGNLFFELNRALRKRGQEQRTALIDGWGVYMHYIMAAMAKLPKVEGVCYRGYPDKAVVLAQYKPGRPIQWGAFASTSTDFEITKGFTIAVRKTRLFAMLFYIIFLPRQARDKHTENSNRRRVFCRRPA